MDLLSGTDASGRQISLLNVNKQAMVSSFGSNASSVDEDSPSPNQAMSSISPYSSDNEKTGSSQTQVHTKRKYHCREPGCDKSFTTSGHLARHNRIHTGEKNFRCLFPGCQSRFSRQDNMMQHYRTHMSPKSRRTHKSKYSPAEDHPVPHLHAHHRFRSDSHRVQPPLTIDQHLSQHHHRQELPPRRPPPPNAIPMQPSSSTSSTTSASSKTPPSRRYGFHPYLPPSSSGGSSSFPVPVAIRQITSNGVNSPHNTPALTALSSTTLPPISQIMELPATTAADHQQRSRSSSHHRLPTPPTFLDRSLPSSSPPASLSAHPPRDPFFRPPYVENNTNSPPSLLGPMINRSHEHPPSPFRSPPRVETHEESKDDDEDALRKRTEMLKLAHIVSTFG
ncbi:hypothetical protein K450DRAFT_300421 [Umbelopsis ramanniana AG]|uniref:C2H2-type domain-containing protein n=1 Tax=Umbelopsis ramanniana AG TaxID=1314678 RepID=A0AAD5EAG2_UMBRA|nr:uncharacterized protein K450DRAFT_300421 [Umbelopsis ramanniana AG]KAI8579341.1 hypothetical protein K450DRAFT_300421 [Umbelopsis ramanniana AG]